MHITTIILLITSVIAHSIVSTDYVEECDNSICEYTNKIVLLIHPYYYNNITIGYDNMTSSDIYFDLHSAYYLYDVNATEHYMYDYAYEYYYNCMNEIFNMPYELECNSTIIGQCDYYNNVIPFSSNDCLGFQKRYLEISYFRRLESKAICVKKNNISPRLSGTLTVGNNSVIFDVELEIGHLSTISSNAKLTLLSSIDKRGLTTVCKRYHDVNGIVLDLLKGKDINDFISRRIINNHLITNFQEKLVDYELDDDLIINQRGLFKIDNSTYFFLYYTGHTINGTEVCKPLPYSDNYKYMSNHEIVVNGETVQFYIDRNCTKQVEGTVSPSFTCSGGFEDAEGNLFCNDNGYIRLYTGKVVSQEIQDDFMIQLSYKGNYKTKQVFYDRCRIRSIEYVNRTVYLYDCEDYVYIKNKYTDRVYKVHNNMQITLPDGLYYLADYISSPLLYVTNSIPTNTMYYAKDKLYAKIMVNLGFNIATIEQKSSYIIYYIIFVLVVVLIIFTFFMIAKKVRCTRCKKTVDDGSAEEKEPLLPMPNMPKQNVTKAQVARMLPFQRKNYN